MQKSLNIILIGAGPANLMSAEVLAEAGHRVQIFERNKAAARKFLVAGHGGFNLTHNEPIDDFVKKYDAEWIKIIVRAFDNQATIKWLNDLGITTYVGSSGKIFPTKEIKPIQVLQAWLQRLQSLNVLIHYGCMMKDFDNDTVTIESNEGIQQHSYDRLILGLGGKSWAKTGSDGMWESLMIRKDVDVTALSPANSGYVTDIEFTALESMVLKNIAVKYDDILRKGEIVFTNYGIEGAPIYYTNQFVRKIGFPNVIYLDLKPNLTEEEILLKLNSNKPISTILKEKLNLKGASLTLLRLMDKDTYNNKALLAQKIKHYPINITAFRPIDEVISTAGGIQLNSLNKDLSLKHHPNVYINGEMLDWEAPTGGYLLQACFSLGRYIGINIKSQFQND